jgi:hypothetical protein
VRVSVLLAAIVLVLAYRLVGRKFFEPDLEVMEQTALIVVDEH